MNEKQAKKAQVDGAGSDGPDEQELRQRTLVEFLRKLVEAEGRTRAAEMVGVNYRTLVNAEESGELTGRMSDALELMLLTSSGPVEPNQDGKSDRLDRLEAELNALAKELRGGLREIRAAVAGQTEAAGQTQPPAAEPRRKGRPWSPTGPPLRWPGWVRRSLSGCVDWSRRSSPRSLQRTTPKSTVRRGRWWRSGVSCGPAIPTKAGPCRG